MRGEHGVARLTAPPPPGSSPRARGAPGFDAVDDRRAGIIPACAGSTGRRRGLLSRPRDHPRVRGEHGVARLTAPPPPGSSPRARGARHLHPRRAIRGRIIPACAGSTRYAPRSPWPWWDHPRVRGEHGVARLTAPPPPGSSPRARGALLVGVRAAAGVGIIPACAGSTGTGRPAGCPWGDHPRVRGEHSCVARRQDTITGSSPRARGAPPNPIITSSSRRDHPRVRGEHTVARVKSSPLTGSSPRARGAHAPGGRGDPRPGIIPACAGSTLATSYCIRLHGDHPRVRGEHWMSTSPVDVLMGSSPRARGAPDRSTDRPAVRGIIPACAGSTSWRPP